MDKAGKIAASILTVIIVISCLALPLVKPVNSQSMSNPSLPEFSLDNVDNVSASAAPSAQSTPYEVLPSSTFATPQTYYSVPPLSSVSLRINLGRGYPCSFSVYIKGGSGNDINLIINPEGRIIYDLGRISNETSFKFYADKPGDYTIILDNEFSVFASKGVNVLQGNITFSTFEFAGLSINFWVIFLLIILSLVVLVTFVVWLRKRKIIQSDRKASK